MKYDDFLTQIYLRHSSNVKLGLDRMYQILENMNNPEQHLQGIHIAGTNGKGSTSAMSEAILLAHGHTTGMNTSPHLIDYTERFRINGEIITSDELMTLYHKYQPCFDQTEASFFEITTALAFKLFVDKKVKSSIVEVGLGGRLDGTYPFNSSVTVITSISIDHPKSLGDNIEKIAYEKAGIIKNNKPVVLGLLKESALKVLCEIANERKSPLYICNQDFFIENIKITNEGTTFDYACPKLNLNLKNVKTNLLGKHQAYNAGLAITATSLYLSSIKESLNITKLYEALDQVNWQGRMQVLSQNPFVIIDGAHNEEGVSSLVENIKNMFPNKRYHFLVAILRDKKLDNMIKEICTIADDIYISKNHSDRAADIQEQIDVAIACNTKYYADLDIINSLKKCLNNFKDENDILIITGSLYTISEVLKVKDEIFK